jgi:hypothetical protein
MTHYAIIRRRAAVVLAATVLAAGASASGRAPKDQPEEPGHKSESSAEYVEYRSLPELGQITISDGVARGKRTVASVKTKVRELAHRGIYPCVDRKRAHTYRRSDEIEGHKFETTIVIAPPEGDEEEDDWDRRVTVTVDGRKKVDCSIGQSPDGIFVYGVTIYPEDGTVEVSAVADDGTELVPRAEYESLDDPGVITDDTLQPAPEDEDEMAAPKIEKA